MRARLHWACIKVAAWTTVSAFALWWADTHTVVVGGAS